MTSVDQTMSTVWKYLFIGVPHINVEVHMLQAYDKPRNINATWHEIEIQVTG